MSEPRTEIYHDLHSRQLTPEEAQNRYSAERVLQILWQYLVPKSVLDVGCGIGTWLSVLAKGGVGDLRGIDGPWLNTANLVCDPSWVESRDLEAGFDLGRGFDLVISIEVAEHLAATAAQRFVASLAQHAPAVLFSAAIPFQGGHHHVNEQFLPYWARIFAERGFGALDLFRGRLWDDPQVHWWIRQNIVLFVHRDLLAANDALVEAAESETGPFSVVHPDVYLGRVLNLLNRVSELQRLEAYLRLGGTFHAEPAANGGLQVTRLG